MVAAEAAACGALPVSAAHSGLAEVSDALARRCPSSSRAAVVPGRRRRGAALWPTAWSAGWRPIAGAARGHPRRARERSASAGPGTAWPRRDRGGTRRARRAADALNGLARRPRAGAEAPARSDSVPPADEPHASLSSQRPLPQLVAGCGRARVRSAAGALALGGRLLGQGRRQRQRDRRQEAIRHECGSCHTLARAETKASSGPTSTKRSARASPKGCKRDTIRGVVEKQIQIPNPEGAMPKGLVSGATRETSPPTSPRSAAESGKDSGLLATAVKRPARASRPSRRRGKLSIPASPSGQLAYVTNKATGQTGRGDHRNAQHVRRLAQHLDRNRRRRRGGEGLEGRRQRIHDEVHGQSHGHLRAGTYTFF